MPVGLGPRRTVLGEIAVDHEQCCLVALFGEQARHLVRDDSAHGPAAEGVRAFRAQLLDLRQIRRRHRLQVRVACRRRPLGEGPALERVDRARPVPGQRGVAGDGAADRVEEEQLLLAGTLFGTG